MLRLLPIYDRNKEDDRCFFGVTNALCRFLQRHKEIAEVVVPCLFCSLWTIAFVDRSSIFVQIILVYFPQYRCFFFFCVQ